MFKSKKRLLIAGLVLLTLITIPLTVFLSQEEQDDRSSAAAASTLYFNPTTTSTSPLVKSIDDTFTLDLMVNPGTNKVSTIRYEILYDDTKLALDGNTPVSINNIAFPANLEGPILGGGRIAGSISIGSDYNLAVTTPTKVITIRFRAVNATGSSPTSLTLTAKTQVLSVGSSEQAAENVLSSRNPAYIRIAAAATPTPTPYPPTLNFSASPTTVAYNGSSTLSWSSTNTTECRASNSWSGSKNTSGSQSTGPLTSNRTFTLICSGPGGSVNRSVTVSVGAMPTPTNIPTPTQAPTPTPLPQETTVNLTVFLHGIGNSGDNANPTAHSLSNKNPQRTVRPVEVTVYDATDTLITKKAGTVTYNPAGGNFKGSVSLGTQITTGVYTLKVTSPFYLTKRISGIQTLTAGITNTLPQITLVTGDTNEDNALNILDYNMIIGCYSDFGPAASCTVDQKMATDITDDGSVNQFDYNLFLRDLSVQNGD